MAAAQYYHIEDQVVSILNAHPWTEHLRRVASDVESDRAVIHVAPEDARNHFTTGSLSTERCFVSPPALVTSRQERTLLAVYYLGPGFAGHRGIVHGGVIATILDECAGRAAGCHFDACKIEANQSTDVAIQERSQSSNAAWNVVAVTARMAVKFKKPAMTNSFFIVEAVVDQGESSGRKATATSRLFSVADTVDGSRSNLLAEATATFVNPNFATL